MKMVTIVGARPQFVKAAAVSREISKHPQINEVIIHTGQHFDDNMSRVFFDEMQIPEATHYLNVHSIGHGAMTGRMLEGIEAVLLKERPDAVLIYGDTDSTLAGALAAAKLHIKVVHVEAGLRSYNRYMPEEINRVLSDQVSTLLLCPSKTAVMNLSREGLDQTLNGGELVPADYFSQSGQGLPGPGDKNHRVVINVGDVMYDVLLYSVAIAERRSAILDLLRLAPRSYILLTAHRAENTDDQEEFERLIYFVNSSSNGTPVIFPMHPRTRKIYENSKVRFDDTVRIIEPIGYFDMLMLLRQSLLVMTDSGGLQKEAYWLKVPCVTLRNETEWVETVQSGWNILFKEYRGAHRVSDTATSYYGDGKAAGRIADMLVHL